MKNTVNVLCSEKVITGDYKVAFETFIETKLNRTVVWINTASDLNEREKYLLLCELKTRAPEDAEFEFERLGIKSKKNGSEKHIMIVVMQKSASGKEESIFNCLGTAEHSLHKHASTKVLYHGSKPYLCPCNDKAKRDIENFLSC